MKTRFKKNAKIFDIVITALAGLVACFVTEATKASE